MFTLAGLALDLLEARKAVETFEVDDIRNMFEGAAYEVEFDNDKNCYYYAYEAGNVAELINSGLALVESLQAESDEFVTKDFEDSDNYPDYSGMTIEDFGR